MYDPNRKLIRRGALELLTSGGLVEEVYVILLDNFLLLVDVSLDDKFEAYSIRGKVSIPYKFR